MMISNPHLHLILKLSLRQLVLFIVVVFSCSCYGTVPDDNTDRRNPFRSTSIGTSAVPVALFHQIEKPSIMEIHHYANNHDYGEIISKNLDIVDIVLEESWRKSKEYVLENKIFSMMELEAKMDGESESLDHEKDKVVTNTKLDKVYIDIINTLPRFPKVFLFPEDGLYPLYFFLYWQPNEGIDDRGYLCVRSQDLDALLTSGKKWNRMESHSHSETVNVIDNIPKVEPLNFGPSHYSPDNFPHSRRILKRLSETARRYQTTIVVSIYEASPKFNDKKNGITHDRLSKDPVNENGFKKSKSKYRYYNTAIAFGPEGHLIARYRKRNLYGDAEREVITPGTAGISEKQNLLNLDDGWFQIAVREQNNEYRATSSNDGDSLSSTELISDDDIMDDDSELTSIADSISPEEEGTVAEEIGNDLDSIEYTNDEIPVPVREVSLKDKELGFLDTLDDSTAVGGSESSSSFSTIKPQRFLNDTWHTEMPLSKRIRTESGSSMDIDTYFNLGSTPTTASGSSGSAAGSSTNGVSQTTTPRTILSKTDSRDGLVEMKGDDVIMKSNKTRNSPKSKITFVKFALLVCADTMLPYPLKSYRDVYNTKHFLVPSYWYDGSTSSLTQIQAAAWHFGVFILSANFVVDQGDNWLVLCL